MVTDAMIPVLLCVDVEPDEFFVDRRNPRPWTGFEKTHLYFRDLRARLEDITGREVNFCWCLRMDAQVATAYGAAEWVVERYPEFIEEYRKAGDEIGSHVHTYRWSERDADWIDDFGDHAWVSECLEMSADAHRRIFGSPSRTLRFGVYWSSAAAINRAEALGYRFDITVEPGLPPGFADARKPFQTDRTPGYYRMPREPYRPDRAVLRKRARNGRRKITLIPLTSGARKYGIGWTGLKRWTKSAFRNGFRNRHANEPLSMWRSWEGVNSYGNMLDRAIAAQERPYLAFAVHSNFPVTKSFAAVDSSMKALLELSASSRFVFCKPADLLKIRDRQGHG